MKALEGKVAVVTGASRGIGAAVARALDEQGVRLGLASRSGDDLGIDGAVAQPCDIRDPDQIEALVGATVERFGRLDIAVANAGVGAYGLFLELQPDDVEEMIDVNVKGLLYTVRAALPHLIESGEGDLVTVASEAGRRGFPRETVYCASKLPRSASPAPWITSCASTASAAPTSAPAASRRTSAWAAAGRPTCPSSRP
jgi:3-oxoacyl-[acyl-carrier protein] reductase